MKKQFLILLLLISLNAYSQINENNHGEVYFNTGLPEEFIKIPWSDAFYAKIEADTFFQSLYLVYESIDDFPSDANIFYIRNNGIKTFYATTFQTTENGLYQSRITLKTPDEDQLTPLILTVSSVSRGLQFNWFQSNDNLPYISKEYELKSGNRFPDIKIIRENETKTIADYKNKIIVINWWATTCIPCIEEMPGLNTLVEKYKSQNVEFISIIYDKENLSDFLKRYKFNYKHSFANEEIIKILGNSFPRNIIINQDGIIRYNQLGGYKNKHEELDKIIQLNL